MAIASEIENDPDVIDGVEYPSSDGEPMAETGVHVRTIIRLFQLLDVRFGKRADVYFAADMNWYWEKGKPSACCSPDVMVNFGVTHNNERRSFMSWREGGVIPAVAFEMASKKTWCKNIREKKKIYECQGVREYFIFDPDFEFLEAPLLGFRLRRGKYNQISPEADGSMLSRELGLILVPRGVYLRLIDPNTGEMILTGEERAEQEKQRAEQEKQRADTLEEEVNRLRAQLRQQKNGSNGANRGKPSS